jgi:hypothetical protein
MNGRFTTGARRAAAERGIDLVTHNELCRLLEASLCTPADIEVMESRRLAFMRDVQILLESLLRVHI